MKNKEFYHSSVEIKEYPFNKIYLEELNKKLIENVKLFNSCKDINKKIEISKEIPIEFPKCRFCGKTIINSNFKILLRQKEKYIQIFNPTVYCREIDGNKYYLSCCKECLLEHFKDNPPKSEKYYFMKANIYGQYCFGYSDEEYKKICSMTVGVTYNSMIKKWGKELGEKKWDEYCKKHSKIASKEYFIQKYGENEGLKIYHDSRAITKKGMIQKYGEELGIKKWENYCKQQKITKSFDYMINKYGYDKAIEINKSKALTLNNFIKKYGEIEGNKKYIDFSKKHIKFYSKISQKLFNELDEYLGKKYTTYYATKNNEYSFKIIDKYVCLDYFIKELNICIEYNGSIFHGEPRLFNDNDKCNPFINLTAKEIRENDEKRYKLLKEIYNIDTYIIWELDYNKNFNVKNYINNILKIKL